VAIEKDLLKDYF